MSSLLSIKATAVDILSTTAPTPDTYMWTNSIMRSIVVLDSFDKGRREYKRLGWG